MLNLKYNIASTLILLILDYFWLTTYESKIKTMIKTIQGTEMKLTSGLCCTFIFFNGCWIKSLCITKY